jgi:hypothetical protein
MGTIVYLQLLCQRQEKYVKIVNGKMGRLEKMILSIFKSGES